MTATISFRREDLERTIEFLVALLDHAEPNPDLEPSGDEEPSGREAERTEFPLPTLRV